MTVNDLRERLEEYPGETVLYAYDGEEEMVCPVTGLLFTPAHGSAKPMLEFCTDEP